MVGGRDWRQSKVNLATQDCTDCGQQAGSAFKPFVLAAALEDEFALQGCIGKVPRRSPSPTPA